VRCQVASAAHRDRGRGAAAPKRPRHSHRARSRGLSARQIAGIERQLELEHQRNHRLVVRQSIRCVALKPARRVLHVARTLAPGRSRSAWRSCRTAPSRPPAASRPRTHGAASRPATGGGRRCRALRRAVAIVSPRRRAGHLDGPRAARCSRHRSPPSRR
jgi:hypothetical protein